MKRTGAVDKRADKAIRESIVKSSRHRDAYTSPNQPRDTYLSTYDMAERLSKWIRAGEHYQLRKGASLPYPEGVLRWCRRWFGSLPRERIGGKGNGYRIPHSYEYVARAWWLSENPQVRRAAERLLVADPKPWLVVVGNFGSTHYTATEVAGRVESLLAVAKNRNEPIQVLYIGPMEGQASGRPASEGSRQEG